MRSAAALCVAVENGLGDELLPGEPRLGSAMLEHFEFSLDQVTLPYLPQEA